MTLDAILRSRDRLAFRHYNQPTVHLFTDCPEGKLIGIARRNAVTDQTALEGLELCAWCKARESERVPERRGKGGLNKTS